MKNSKTGIAIASMVVGIVATSLSVFTMIIPFFSIFFGSVLASISLICGIVAIVFGANAKNQKPAGRAIAGFILGIIASSFSMITIITCLMINMFL